RPGSQAATSTSPLSSGRGKARWAITDARWPRPWVETAVTARATEGRARVRTSPGRRPQRSTTTSYHQHPAAQVVVEDVRAGGGQQGGADGAVKAGPDGTRQPVGTRRPGVRGVGGEVVAAFAGRAPVGWSVNQAWWPRPWVGWAVTARATYGRARSRNE